MFQAYIKYVGKNGRKFLPFLEPDEKETIVYAHIGSFITNKVLTATKERSEGLHTNRYYGRPLPSGNGYEILWEDVNSPRTRGGTYAVIQVRELQ